MAEDYSEYGPQDVTPELVKQTVTVHDVLDMLGIEVNSANKFTSPWNPTERTPSAHAYDDHYYCYATGNHGDIFDLVQAYNPGATLGSLKWKIWTKALRAGREPGDVEKQPVRELVEFRDDLPTTPVDVLLGLNVRGFGLRQAWNGDIWVPHAQQGEPAVYGVKLRLAAGGKSSIPGSQFGHRLYSPVGDHTCRAKACVITEGESDSWAIWTPAVQQHVDVYALPSGASAWKDHWMSDLEGYDTIWLAFDNDKAGKAAFDKVVRKVGYDRAKMLKVPGLYGDVREAIAAGWQPKFQ